MAGEGVAPGPRRAASWALPWSIALGGLLVMGITTVLAFALSEEDPTARAAAESFVAALNDGDTAAARDLACDRDRRLPRVPRGTDLVLGEVEDRGSRATAAVTARQADGTERRGWSAQVRLRERAEGWCVVDVGPA